MTTWLPRWIACLVLVLPFVPVVADDADDKEIAGLVKQLGSSDFRIRDKATARLKEVGEPALDALQNTAKTDDTEVRRRVTDIVLNIENKLCVERRLTGHTSKVLQVLVSADNKLVLTSSDDKTLRLWDVETGKELRVFKGHTDHIMGAALSPDGKRVLSGSHDRTVRLWDAETAKELCQMIGHVSHGVDGGVLSVAFGPNDLAISVGFDRTLRLWDLRTGKNTCVLTGHSHWIPSVAFHERTMLAATCSMDSDRSIRLWNLETRKQVRHWVTQSRYTTKVSFSPDGKRLVSVSLDCTLRIWDVESGKELKQIQTSRPDVRQSCAAYSLDGKRFVTGASDGTVQVWDAESGKELRKYVGHTASVVSVAFFPDGKRIASASEDGTVRIWRAPR